MDNSLHNIKDQFPLLTNSEAGRHLSYLDNAATTQKPLVVIETMDDYYRHYNASTHRGLYRLAEQATLKYEDARRSIARFINAESPDEIIFLRGTTEAINLVAHSYGSMALKPGDEIILTRMEHHSNIVPWQLIANRMGAIIRTSELNELGELDEEYYRSLFNNKTKIVAITHASNVLGTINHVEKLCQIARAYNVTTLVDGAQAAGRLPIDVRKIGCDFYTLSGHKAYGPTGIGVLYGRRSLLERMPPYQGGGGMIQTVSMEQSSFAPIPYRFEAGTGNICGAIGLAAALGFIEKIGLAQIQQHEQELLKYALDQLSSVKGISLIGRARERLGIISWNLDWVHPHDLATILSTQGVAVRAGHHCAMPLMELYGLPGTTRASLGVYNNPEDIERLVVGIEQARKILTR